MPLSIDLIIVKNIHRDNIRKARQPLLDDLDIQFMQALEQGKDTSSIVALKQTLRDEPDNPDIDAATTINEVKEQWNEGLLGNSPYKQDKIQVKKES